MLAAIADSAQVAWPLALSCATVTLVERVRGKRLRRRLNRAMHELRRPLQVLTLARRAEPGPHGGTTQLTQALAALEDLDREVNGGAAAREPRVIEARWIAEAAVERWRASAAGEARTIELRWWAPASRVCCDAAAIARALDNLIANALEHGSGTIRVEGRARPGHLRLFVCDGGDRGSQAELADAHGARRGAALAPTWRGNPRRGHGLGVVAEVAAAHDGRFAACRHGDGASAVIELPLVE